LLSLLAGILFCAPPFALAALALGVNALRSNKPQIGGRLPPCIGIFLSLLSFSLFGWVLYTAFIMSVPAHHFMDDVIYDLSTDQTDAALAKCDSSVTPDDVDQWAQEIQALGTPVKVQYTSLAYMESIRGRERRFMYTLGATVSGPSGASRSFFVGLLHSHGTYRLWSFE
jgi:hypothetical protein